MTKEHFVKKWGEFPIEIYKKLNKGGEIEIDKLNDLLEAKNQNDVPETQPISQPLEDNDKPFTQTNSKNKPAQNLTVPNFLQD